MEQSGEGNRGQQGHTGHGEAEASAHAPEVNAIRTVSAESPSQQSPVALGPFHAATGMS